MHDMNIHKFEYNYKNFDEFVECIKTGELNGETVIGYWIDDNQKWMCPECFEDFLGRIAPCVAGKEPELFLNECGDCGENLIPTIGET